MTTSSTDPTVLALKDAVASHLSKYVGKESKDVLRELADTLPATVDRYLANLARTHLVMAYRIPQRMGEYEHHVVVRDRSTRPKHRKNHFAVVLFTDESEVHYYQRGVSWRRAKKVLAEKVASANGMVNLTFYVKPPAPVNTIDVQLKL